MQTAGQAKTAATPASPDAPHPADGDGSHDAPPPADSGGPSPRPCPPARTDDWVLATIQDHAATLLNTARRHSLCRDDAQDAYQRAIEIFLGRADRLERATVTGWLHTVVNHHFDLHARRASRPADASPR